MLRWTRPFSRRAVLASALAAASISAAGAATYHRLVVTQTAGGGSGGATEFLQTATSGGAVQGEVGSSADTSLGASFGLFGYYHSSSSTFGSGVIGISSTGYGVAAESDAAEPSILALSEGTGTALEAETTSSKGTAPAIYALSANGAAADGIDAQISGGTKNYAVSGTDLANNGGANAGVYGSSTGDGYGVFGQGVGTAQGGVTGQSASGTGVLGIQTTSASPAPDVFKENGVSAYAENGAGVYSYARQDPAIAAEMGCNAYTNVETETGQNCSGLFIQEDGTSGYPLMVYEPSSNQNCSDKEYPFFVNSAGDVYECGTTTTAYVYQRNSNPASDAVSYSAKQTESTVEDFGSAQLVNGSASIALAADFKQTMNTNAAYMVFLTPYGDGNGLYIASRSPAGFVVREQHGGRSSMSFDYRIVARPYGERPARLPHESQLLAHRPMGQPSERKNYAQLIAAAEARNAAGFGGSKSMPMEKLQATRPHAYVPPPIPANFASALQRIK